MKLPFCKCRNSFTTGNGSARLFGANRYRAWLIVFDWAEVWLPKLINLLTGKIDSVSSHWPRDIFTINAETQDSSGGGLKLLQEHLGNTASIPQQSI